MEKVNIGVTEVCLYLFFPKIDFYCCRISCNLCCSLLPILSVKSSRWKGTGRIVR